MITMTKTKASSHNFISTTAFGLANNPQYCNGGGVSTQLAQLREQLTLELAILSEQKTAKVIQLLEESPPG